MLFLLLFSSAAFAQAPGPGRPAAAADPVQASFDKGVGFAKQRRWAEARAAFLEAWAVAHDWWIAANLGHCEMQLGQYAAAATHYTYYLREAPAEWKQKAKALFEKARSKVGALVIKVNVEGAEVSVNGAKIDVWRQPTHEWFVEPGKVAIEATLAGYEKAQKTIDVAEGSSQDVVLELVPVRATDKPKLEQAQAEPAQATALRPEAAPAIPERTSTSAEKPALLWVIAGGAVALTGIGVGIGMTVATKARSADRKNKLAALQATDGASPCGEGRPLQNAQPCAALMNMATEHRQFQAAAVGAFVIGGAAAVATGLYTLWPRRSRSRSDTSAAFVVGPGVVAVTVAARF